MSKISICTVAFIIATNTLVASMEPEEHETLSFKAQFQLATTEDVVQLAYDSVEVAYEAYKKSYDQMTNEFRENFDGINLSSLQRPLLNYTKDFASSIINQVEPIAQRLSHKNFFWKTVEEQVKSLMLDYAKSLGIIYEGELYPNQISHNQKYTSELNEHIENIINMKKKF